MSVCSIRRALPLLSSQACRTASLLGNRCSFPNHQFPGAMRFASVVPYVIEKTGGGERVYDIYSRLLQDRIICLMANVDESVANSVVAQLLFLEKEDDTKPIQMYINSGGGSVPHGLAIYDTMQHIQAPVTTLCIGRAFSMAAVLLAAGSPGSRYALPHARIMIHQPQHSSSGWEKETDAVISVKELTNTRKTVDTILAKHTGQTEEEIHNLTANDHFMSAEEASKLGMIDKVLK